MEEKKENNVHAVEQFEKRFKPADLIISRVPKKELSWFKDKANKEFCGDFGMLLKNLIDSYHRLQMYEADVPSLNELTEKVNYLLSKSNETNEKEKVVTTLSGRTIRKGE